MKSTDYANQERVTQILYINNRLETLKNKVKLVYEFKAINLFS